MTLLAMIFGLSTTAIPNASNAVFEESEELEIPNDFQEDICYNQGTCAFNENLDHPRCYCDDRCSIFNDCCLDADKAFVKEANDTQRNANTSCEGSDINIPSFQGIYMISECSVEYSFNNSGDFFRYPVVDKQGNVYKTENIALCNEVFEYEKFDIGIYLGTCKFFLSSYSTVLDEDVDDIIDMIRSKNCMITVRPPAHSKVRKCWKQNQEHLYESQTSSHYTPPSVMEPTNCARYQNPVFAAVYGDRYFRNYFCRPNNHTTVPGEDKYDPKYLRCAFPENDLENRIQKGFSSLAVLFNFNTRLSHEKCGSNKLVSSHINGETNDQALFSTYWRMSDYCSIP